MTTIIKKQEVEIFVPKENIVYVDKRSNAKSCAFQFTFPDGVDGLLTITRMTDKTWIPSNDIKHVSINFGKYED
jgi:hypothetical protein